jgi:hypothetical protein
MGYQGAGGLGTAKAWDMQSRKWCCVDLTVDIGLPPAVLVDDDDGKIEELAPLEARDSLLDT